MGSSTSKEEVPEDFVYDVRSIFYDDLGNLCYGPNEAAKRNIKNEIKVILNIESEEDELLQAEIDKKILKEEQEKGKKILKEEQEKGKKMKLLSEGEAKELPDEKLSTIVENDDENDVNNSDLIEEEKSDLWYVMDSSWVENWLAHVHLNQDQPGPGPCDNRRLIEWNADEKKWTGREGLLMAIKSKTGDYRRVSENVWKAYKKFYPDNGPAISFVMKRSESNASGKYNLSNWTVHDHPVPSEHEQKKKKKFFRGFGKTDGDNEDEEKKDNKENILKDTNTSILDNTLILDEKKDIIINIDEKKDITINTPALTINAPALTINTNINNHNDSVVNTVKTSSAFIQKKTEVADVDSDDDYVVTTPIVSPTMYSINTAEIDSDDDM